MGVSRAVFFTATYGLISKYGGAQSIALQMGISSQEYIQEVRKVDMMCLMLPIERVRAAMRRPLPGPAAQVTMAPQPRPFRPPDGVVPRQAGVLLLLYPIRDRLHLVLTVRTPGLNHHSGQIS